LRPSFGPHAHAEPVRFVVRASENVGKDDHLVLHEVRENDRVVLFINVLYDAEHAKLNVYSAELSVYVAE
jgi:GTPase Era involved in 16S rRNA processing